MTEYIEKILEQSKWLVHQTAIENDIHLEKLDRERYQWREENFLQHDFDDGVYFIFGPRQIGKTTHIKMLFRERISIDNHENFLYFNCDLLDSKKDIVDLVEQYLANFPDKKNRIYIALDEVTSVKNSVLAVKYLIDEGKSKNTTYLLSGSSSANVKKTGEYLPGRRGKGIDFIFKPLSFFNFVRLKYPQLPEIIDTVDAERLAVSYATLKQNIPIADLFEQYLICGGIPKIINVYWDEGQISSEIFDIYKNWIVSEILKGNKKEYLCKLILERVLNSLSSDISYNAFIQDANIGSHNTVHDYIDFMDSSFFIRQIFHYDIHQEKINYRKNKKIYFFDPFIFWLIDKWLNARDRQNLDYLNHPVLKSRLVENVVFNELDNRFSGELYYFKSNFEIDFVSADHFYEVKYQNHVAPSDYGSLIKVRNKRHGYVVSKSDLDESHEKLKVIPVDFFLLLSLPVIQIANARDGIA